MSAQVLLNLSNKLGKRDQMRGLKKTKFCISFSNFNNTGERRIFLKKVFYDLYLRIHRI